MAITGYSIYRYTDKGDPNLSFDIVILESDSDQYSSNSAEYRIVPTNVKIPFATNNMGKNPITTIQKNAKANLQITTDITGSITSIIWEYNNKRCVMCSANVPIATDETSSFTVAYPVIIHYNGKYYASESGGMIIFYNSNPANIRTIWTSKNYFNTYAEIIPNQDKDIDPIYPWYGDDLNSVYCTGDKPNVVYQDKLSWNPPYSGFSTYDITDFIEPILGVSKKKDTDDPYPDGGDSQGGGGGGGNGNIGGDTNSDDGLPDISALDSGLLTAYNPNVDELQALGRFLWSDSFDVNAFKKLFNDPFDTLLGLSIVPVQPQTRGNKNIMFGNLDSGVSAAVVSNQWVSMDMGTLHLNEVWKGALDYAPSTGVCIYLPFIGMRQLNVNDIMGSSLHLIYKFDVLTGAVIAQIYVNHDNRGNPSQGFSYTKNMGLCYEFIGQCGENIPLASQDFTNTIRAAITGVSVAAGAAASVATGNPALGIAALTVGAANAGMQANTPTVERGGHLSGSASIMGYSQPFLIVERPHQCKPSRYYSLRGIPSQVYTSKLANCTGFTQITDNNNIHASGAQDAELEEIERLLTSGVYFPNNVRS